MPRWKVHHSTLVTLPSIQGSINCSLMTRLSQHAFERVADTSIYQPCPEMTPRSFRLLVEVRFSSVRNWKGNCPLNSPLMAVKLSSDITMDIKFTTQVWRSLPLIRALVLVFIPHFWFDLLSYGLSCVHSYCFLIYAERANLPTTIFLGFETERHYNFIMSRQSGRPRRASSGPGQAQRGAHLLQVDGYASGVSMSIRNLIDEWETRLVNENLSRGFRGGILNHYYILSNMMGSLMEEMVGT